MPIFMFRKLYVTIRRFSFAKDIVNKYKLSQGSQKKKALRKDLKRVCKYLNQIMMSKFSLSVQKVAF